jgi:SH3-like domain-containing protein
MLKKYLFSLLSILLILSFNQISLAEKFTPHYSSIKSSEVNVRKGPNTRYRIEWVYKNKGEPVEVIAKFEHWNKIRDVDGAEGWMKTIMLTKKRTGIILPLKKESSFVNMYRKPDASSRVFARIESSKRVVIEKCKEQWCKIRIKEISGWVNQQNLWGVYANEEFK